MFLFKAYGTYDFVCLFSHLTGSAAVDPVGTPVMPRMVHSTYIDNRHTLSDIKSKSMIWDVPTVQYDLTIPVLFKQVSTSVPFSIKSEYRAQIFQDLR